MSDHFPTELITHNPMAKSTLLLLSIISLLTTFDMAAAATPSVVKAAYWFPDSGFAASNINSALFTHLFCAFADLDPVSYRATISSANSAAFASFTSTVRSKNPSVGTLLSIGGGGGGKATERNFSIMASGPSSRKAFIDSSIQLARSNGFSGLDLDWEYPRTTTDMFNMGTLLNEWRAAVASESTRTGSSPLLLTAAVYYSSSLNGVDHPADLINKNLDWINVMAYDYYDPTWKHVTSAHAALYDSSSQLSASAGIGDWTSAGLPSKKIVLGLPFYGYAWKLANPANHGLGAAAPGVASGPGIDPKTGSISYNQIKAFIRNNGATTVYNGDTVVNYCYSGTTWIGYDDVQAVDDKITYSKDNGLLGYFAWSVGADDNWVLSQRASSKWDGNGQ